jgi:hypothetical protein
MELTLGAMRVAGMATCRTETLYSSPRDYLLGLLGRTGP